MSEQYRCKSCGYVFDMKDMMCSECGIGYFERLHWTKGGDGSHWEGCADVHWDCRIAQLEAELARLQAENDLLTSAIMESETIDDKGKLRGSIVAIQKEVEMLRALNARLIEDKLQAEINLVRGAMAADDKRLLSAGQRVGIYFGCDTPDIMADEIIQSCAEIDRLQAELKTTDGLLKEATETIGAVIACCTYNSNDDTKIGIYGIDQNAFTKIDQFITRYNDAVSAGKVSVVVRRDLSDAEIEELGAQEAEKRGEK